MRLFAFAVVMLLDAAGETALHPLLVEARRLESIAAWNEAVTEYERYLFVCPDSASVTLFAAIAGCHAKKGDHDNASRALERALSLPLCDTARAEIRITMAIHAILGGHWQTAELELLRLRSFAPCEEQRLKAARYLGLVQCISMDWTGFRETAGNTDVYTTDQRRRIDSLLSVQTMNTRVSPATAKWLSTFLPGLGQVYSRDYRNGLNALALSLGTAFLTAHALLNGYFQEALFTDVTLFWRYYNGNRQRAMESAERFNSKKDRALRDTILSILSRQ